MRELAPAIFGCDVVLPRDGEHVAWGAARQAAWVLTGSLPDWSADEVRVLTAEPTPFIQERWDAYLPE